MKSETVSERYGSIADVEPVEATQLVEVAAPSNLPEGYKFTSVYEGVTFQVIVPSGGVVKGQKIVVPFDPNSTLNTTVSDWKDGLFDCCAFGPIHPSFINAIFCPLILLGQVMTRLKLDFLARPTSSEDQLSQTFSIMVAFTVIYMLCGILFPTFSMVLYAYEVFIIITVMNVRKYIRVRDGIPESHCQGCEDLCCGLWCGCCSASQMARQTTDYDTKDARYLTNDGMLSPRSECVMDV